MAAKSKRVRGFFWRHAVGISFLFMILFIAGVSFFAYQYVVITERFEESRQWDLPSRIYSDATPLVPGLTYPKRLLEPKLNQVGYTEVERELRNPGEYRYVGDDLEIYLQKFIYPDIEFHGMAVRVDMNRDGSIERVRRIEDGATLRGVRIEPELITSIYNEVMEDRVPIPLDAVPKHLVDAIIAAEDRRFWEHEGISIRGIGRAVLTNFRTGARSAGGSTLTQQLVKNLFLNPERTYTRKAVEALMAIILEIRFSKEQILEAYLNEIYLGQNGSVQIAGVERASQVYFSKHAKYLTLPEAATLAGMLPSPNAYSPLKHPERAKQRRDLVLRQMRDQGKISEAEYEEAVASPLAVNRFARAATNAPYFVDLVMKQLRETYPETQLQTEGLRVFTTLDTIMQRSAEDALREGLADLEKNYKSLRNRKGPVQGAVITIEPGTGYVKSVVGGRSWESSQFNRAIQARRQPGSLFKPFVYVAAMDPARGSEALTAATVLDDSPITVQTAGSSAWQPQNYDGRFHGSVSVRKALVHSYNIPAVRAAIDAGVPKVVELASKVGVESRLEPYPSISLGSFEVTPLELAYAYSVFANSGVKAEPISILAVSTRDGALLERRDARMTRVAPASVTFVMNDMLKDVLVYGTAGSARSRGFREPFAGKTGTTNDYRDAWFIGYSPQVLSLVWVGFDEGESLRLSGSQAALPIWVDHMKRVSTIVPTSDFRRPNDVVVREIDPLSGQLAGPYCPDTRGEFFVAGTDPRTACSLHGGDYFPFTGEGDDAWREEPGEEPRERKKPSRLERLLRRIFD